MEDTRKMSETEQVSWNLAEQIILQIGNLMQQATVTFLKGNISACFFHYKEIKLLVFADLNDEERERLIKLEKEFNSNSVYLNQELLGRLNKEVYHKIQSKIIEGIEKANSSLQEYRETLVKLLSKYGYHISKKEATNKMF